MLILGQKSCILGPTSSLNFHNRTDINTGSLEDGTKFASDRTGAFQIGETRRTLKAVQGLDQGVLGMCIGEKRRLIIPPELGYGVNEFKNIGECSVEINCLDKGKVIHPKNSKH